MTTQRNIFCTVYLLVGFVAATQSLTLSGQSPASTDSAVAKLTQICEIGDADGPIENARVWAIDNGSVLAEGLTNIDGSAKLTFVPANSSFYLFVLSSGSICQIKICERSESPPTIKLRLRQQKTPFDGRVIDSQAMGVGKADVTITSLMLDGEMIAIPDSISKSHFTCETDENGEFQFDGIDKSVSGQLRVAGTGIVTQFVALANIDAEQLIIAQPAKTIKGRVIDRSTGAPITDVSVTRISGEVVQVDEQGMFQMNGVPAFEPLTLQAKSIGTQSYLAKIEQVPVSPGFQPIELDVEMQPGVAVRCKVTEFGTDQPVHALLYYFPSPENKGFQAFFESFGFLGNAPDSTNATGTAFTTALTGPGVLAVVADGYPQGDSVKQLSQEQRNMLLGVIGEANVTAIELINPNSIEEKLEFEILVSKGRAIDVQLDPEQIDSTDLIVIHNASAPSDTGQRIYGEKFTAQQFQPGQKRSVFVNAIHKRLGAAVEIEAAATSPIQIELQPTGQVIGQAVSEDNEPLAGLSVLMEVSAADDDVYQTLSAPVLTDSEGRFEIPSLIAGLKYRVAVIRPTATQSAATDAPAEDNRWHIAEDLLVNSNETIDFQSFVPSAKDLPTPKRLKTERAVANKFLPNGVSGLIVESDSQPVSEAEVMLHISVDDADGLAAKNALHDKVIARTRSNGSGFFDLNIRSNLEQELVGGNTQLKYKATVVVTADRFGAYQVPLNDVSDAGQLKIEMNREIIVRGKITTDDGAEVVSIVPIGMIDVYDSDSIREVIAELMTGNSLLDIRQRLPPTTMLDPAIGSFAEFQTDSDGKFILRGLPLNCVANFQLLTDAGHKQRITIVGRPMKSFEFESSVDEEVSHQIFGSRIRLQLDPPAPEK